MKGKTKQSNSYTFNHQELTRDEYFDSHELREIENDICRLKTMSHAEDRTLARQIYEKINHRITVIKDGTEIKKLKNLAHILNMKVKVI